MHTRLPFVIFKAQPLAGFTTTAFIVTTSFLSAVLILVGILFLCWWINLFAASFYIWNCLIYKFVCRKSHQHCLRLWCLRYHFHHILCNWSLPLTFQRKCNNTFFLSSYVSHMNDRICLQIQQIYYRNCNIFETSSNAACLRVR